MPTANSSDASRWSWRKLSVWLFLAFALTFFLSYRAYFRHSRYVSGIDLLGSVDNEEPGYGLYSYLVLGEIPTPNDRERVLSIITSVTHLPSADTLKISRPKKQINIIYLPVKERSHILPLQASTILDNYDFERALTITRRLSLTIRRGPYLLSTLHPLSHAQEREAYLLQDLSDVDFSVAETWITDFGAEAMKAKYWAPVMCSRVARDLRTRLAHKLPEIAATRINDWIVYYPNSLSSAIVRFEVNANFDDSHVSVAKLEGLLDFLPPATAIRVHSRPSLQALIQERYGIRKEALPKTYALLENAILRLNPNLQTASPGRIAIPNIPHRVGRPKGISTFGTKTFDRGILSILQEGEPGEFVRNPSSTSSTVLVDYRISENELAIGERQNYLLQNRTPILASVLGVKWAADDRSASPLAPQLLSDSLARTIRQTLETSPARHITVFIVDSGWPEKAYNESQIELLHIFDVVRTKWKMNRAVRQPPSSFVAPSNKHCEEIEA